MASDRSEVTFETPVESFLTGLKKIVKPGKKVAFVSGNFNIVHPGHLRLLRFAADCADYLVVGVQKDGTPGAFLNEELRFESVRSISYVDFAFVLREPPEDFILKLKPDFVVKGSEHEKMTNSEVKAVSSYGGKLLFGSGDVSFSSMDLLQNEFRQFNLSTIRKPKDFPERHGFSFSNLKEGLIKFEGLKILVIGDTIIDEYLTCDPIGMSQEDPTIVVTPIAEEKFIGGAGIVAAHARSLGAQVEFFSVVGNDPTAALAAQKLLDFNVKTHFYTDESRPTTLKQRFRAGGKTLLRVSHLRQHSVAKEISSQMAKDILLQIPKSNLVIFSDFNYGCLPQGLVDEISATCRKHNVKMVADSQSSSQVGDISRFKNMALITPTEREARLALRDFSSGLVVLADNLRNLTKSENVLITLGAEGVMVHAPCPKTGECMTDQLPALNSAPKDVAGGGDSLLTCVSMGLAVGMNIWQSVYLGSLAAAQQVGRIGNIPLALGDLIAEIGNGH